MDEPIDQKPKSFQLWQGHARNIWSGFVDFVTPPKCLTCQTAVESDAGLCITCWNKLRHISEPVCDAMGTPFEYDEGEGALSAAAIADPPPWHRARAAVSFDEHGGKLVHQLKYNDKHEAATVMARLMQVAGRKILHDADVILPVPLHRRRLWQRRYNQAALIAHALGLATGKPVETETLIKVKATRQQVGLDADERRRNVSRAFAINPERLHLISGRKVLLVDDVRTTGATASACAKVLLSQGAAHVDVLTFALVLEPARPDIVA
jgi:ComF family protein